jgi:putative membrane protein
MTEPNADGGIRAKAFNPQVFLEVVCYAAFAALTLYLLRTDKYLTYVTPRMKPYLYFSALVMVLWAAAGAFRMFRPQNNTRSAHCFALAIPILLFLLPHSQLSASDLSYNYGGDSFSGASGVPGVQADGPGAIPYDLPGLDEEAQKITVANEDFYPWLSEIYEKLDYYQGFEISITGFVLNDPYMFAPDEFVPARLGMSCCVADLVPYGPICKYTGASELQPDSWVTVEGVVEPWDFDGWVEPVIIVTNIAPADEVEGYIYPF